MLRDVVDAARALVARRRQAYTATFDNPEGRRVLVDLAHFCRATETCFHEDARLHAVLEGRREVWLRITRHLNLSDDELFELARKRAEQ